MTRDYKKNINHRKNDAPSFAHSIMPFITGLVIGLFVAFIVYLKEHQTPGQVVAEPEMLVEDRTEKTVVADTESSVPAPQFDFYQILPNMEVNVSEWEADEEKPAEPLTEENGVYILQVGSFEQYDAADEVKASLALLGINADIQRVVINGKDIRHRVRVGPYKNLEKLEEARERLLANNLDYMLLKLKVDDI